MRKYLSRSIVLVLLMCFFIFTFCGCTSQVLDSLMALPMLQTSSDFAKFEEGDLYTCQIDEEASFWYSPEYLYGEWIRKGTVAPIKLSFDTGVGRSGGSVFELSIHFYDDLGNRFAAIHISMEGGLGNSKTNAKRALSKKLSGVEVFDAAYQDFIDTEISALTFEDLEVKKIKQQADLHESVFTNFISYFGLHIIERPGIHLSKHSGFWLNFSEGGTRYTCADLGELCTITLPDQRGSHMVLKISEPIDSVKQYPGDHPAEYELFMDEDGVYIWLETDGEKEKARIKMETAEGATPEEYGSFIAPKDGTGNTYLFSCESGSFTYSGQLGLGTWKDGEAEHHIKVSVGDMPFELVISELTSSTDAEIILIADFLKMEDGHIAKFKIRDEYLGSRLFESEAVTEFVIIKQSTLK